LIELSGSVRRADFWIAFASLVLVLVPVIFALGYRPEKGPLLPLVFALGTQTKRALAGLLAAILVMGFFIRGTIKATAAAPKTSEARPVQWPTPNR